MNSNLIKEISKVFTIPFLISIFANCGSNRNYSNSSSDEIREVKIEISFPTLSTGNQFIIVKDSQFISQYKDFVVWQFPYNKEFNSNVFDRDDNIIEHKFIKTEINVQRFIYKKGERFGFYFDSLQDNTGLKCPIDSFMNVRFKINENLLFNKNDNLVKKKSEPDGVINEVYSRMVKTDKWDCDTNNLFFSEQFKEIPFSFSRKLDSISGKKLFRIHQISNGDPTNEMPFFRQRREVVMELKNNPVKNKWELISFINSVTEKGVL
ncbi:MAG: hypothetical protein NTW29_01810 [Bacteroidetes bacterium]|nr:hypothetical protein [Bacteroidota bacterium]